MSDLIKYLSPIALLTLIWAIFQFYQKRKDEKKDKKLVIYNSIHLILKDINFELIKFMSNSRVPMLNTGEEVNLMKQSLKELETQVESFQNEINLIENKIKPSSEDITNLQNKNNNHIKVLKSINLKNKQIVNLSRDELNQVYKNFISTLESKIEELNKVSLLNIPNKSKLSLAILELTGEINSTREFFYTKKHLDKNGVPKPRITENIKRIFEYTYSIQFIIEKDST